MMINNCI